MQDPVAPTIDPPQRAPEPAIFDPSYPKIIVKAAIACLCIIITIAMTAHPRPEQANVIAGNITLTFFGLIALHYMAKIFIYRPMAIVTAEGLSCPDQFAGLIPWIHVRQCDLQILKRERQLLINVDPTTFAALAWRAPARWLRFTPRKPQIAIRLNLIDHNAGRLADICRDYTKTAHGLRHQDTGVAARDEQASLAESRDQAATNRIAASKAFPWVTIGLAILMIIIFFIETLVSTTNEKTISTTAVAQLGGLNWRLVIHGEFYRLFSASLLHITKGHLFGNLLFLLASGLMLEPIIGSAWLAAIFTGSVLAGSAASVTTSDPNTLIAGASAGVMGLLAAGPIISTHFAKGEMQSDLLTRTMRLAAICLILTMFSTHKPSMHVDNAGHVGGAIGGALTAILLLKFWKTDRTTASYATPAAVTAAICLMIGLYPMTRLNFAALFQEHDEIAEAPASNFTSIFRLLPITNSDSDADSP